MESMAQHIQIKFQEYYFQPFSMLAFLLFFHLVLPAVSFVLDLYYVLKDREGDIPDSADLLSTRTEHKIVCGAD